MKTILRALFFGLICLGLLFSLNREWPDWNSEDYQYASAVHNRRFDFIGWELDALGNKVLYSLAPAHTFLDPIDQKTIVLDFFDQLSKIQSLEHQIALIFSDPDIADPTHASAELSRELATARDRLAVLQPLAEGIMEEQIASVLADEGLTTGGRTFPPVKLHFTPLPAMLVVSSRERIEPLRFVPLEHGLETQEWVAMEQEIDERLNVSSLVTNIGGLAAYPAMMLESSAFNWVMETGAHEWTHHYLTLRPLGILYDTDPQLRTMNETVASIVGKEIGAEVVRRYYPELVPPERNPDQAPAPPDELPAFDFRAEMRTTRLRVDSLLAQGQVDEAEGYMEVRRQFFWENGYRIRKLNQAYFAFHGAYADEPGEQGADPVGPAVTALRAQSDSLQTFLRTVAPLTSFDQLVALMQAEN